MTAKPTPPPGSQESSGMSLRAGLTIAVVGLVSAVSIGGGLFMYRAQSQIMRQYGEASAKRLRSETEKRAKLLGRSVALSFERAIATTDFLFINEALNGTLEADKELLFGAVVNREGLAMIRVDRDPEKPVPADFVAVRGDAPEAIQVRELALGKQALLRVEAPIRVSGDVWGTLVFGLSLTGLRQQIKAEQQNLSEQQRAYMIRAMIVALIVTLLVSWFGLAVVGRLVTSPLAKLSAGVRQIRSGSYGHQVALSASRELNELGAALNAMSQSIAERDQVQRTMVARIASAIDVFADTAAHVADGSRRVEREVSDTATVMQQMRGTLDIVNRSVDSLKSSARRGAEANDHLVDSTKGVDTQVSKMMQLVDSVQGVARELAASDDRVRSSISALDSILGDTTSTVKELDIAIRSVEHSAANTQESSEETLRSAEAGADTVRQTIEGIDRIRQSANLMTKVTAGLGAKLRNIGDVADLINSVADQTTLLGLNAAIIAAQAGEKGAGFAVVAEEIRSLAERTARATKEISVQIDSVMAEARAAEDAVEASREAVADGVALSKGTAKALEGIVGATTKSAFMVRQITKAALDQAKASSLVMDGIDKVIDAMTTINERSQAQARLTERLGQIAGEMQSSNERVRHASGDQRQSVDKLARLIDELMKLTTSLDTSHQEHNEGTGAALNAVESIRDVAAQQIAWVGEFEKALGELERDVRNLHGSRQKASKAK